jgi:hypothetical protein
MDLVDKNSFCFRGLKLIKPIYKVVGTPECYYEERLGCLRRLYISLVLDFLH